MRATPVDDEPVTKAVRLGQLPRKSAPRCDAPYKRRMPVVMSVERFEELVSDALDTVPEGLIRLLDNVVILVADESPPGETGEMGQMTFTQTIIKETPMKGASTAKGTIVVAR